jgi:hypothetical protein
MNLTDLASIATILALVILVYMEWPRLKSRFRESQPTFDLVRVLFGLAAFPLAIMLIVYGAASRSDFIPTQFQIDSYLSLPVAFLLGLFSLFNLSIFSPWRQSRYDWLFGLFLAVLFVAGFVIVLSEVMLEQAP